MEFTFKLADQAVQEDKDLLKFAALVKQMFDRMSVSHFKYHNLADKYPHSAHAYDNAAIRLQKYLATGNKEFLLDAANFCLIEFLFPKLEDAFFKPTDGGISLSYIDENKQQGKSIK